MFEIVTKWIKTNNLFSNARNFPQILAIISASILSMSLGAIYAFASPAIPKLLDEYNFTIEEVSYITVIPPLVMLLATPIFCFLADKFGRKNILLSAGVFNIISWISMAFAKSLYVFYISRAFFGISDAGMHATLPAYIAEVTTPKVRSLYGNMMVIFSLLGQFLANCIGFYFNIQIAALIMLGIPILFLASFAVMPESPYFLIMISKDEAAERSLKKLRASEDVRDEIKQLTADVTRQLSESGRFKDLWLIKSNRKALVIAILSRTIQQFSGSGSILLYAQYIFQEAGGDVSGGVAAMIITGIFAFVNLFANLICDKLGRNRSMVISCLGCGIVLLLESVYFYLQLYEIVNLSAINWFPVFGIGLYAIMYCIGLGVVPTLIPGEIFSTNIRKYASTVTNIAFSIYMCTMAKIFQLMMSSYGLWVPFFFFGSTCLVCSIVSYFIIPETKGKTLEEIQQILKGNIQALGVKHSLNYI